MNALTGNLIARAQTPVMTGSREPIPGTTLQASGVAVDFLREPWQLGGGPSGILAPGEGSTLTASGSTLHRGRILFPEPRFLWKSCEPQNKGTTLHLLGIVSFSVPMALSATSGTHGTGQKGRHKKRIHSRHSGPAGRIAGKRRQHIREIEEKSEEIGLGRVVSVIGRLLGPWIARKLGPDRKEHTGC